MKHILIIMLMMIVFIGSTEESTFDNNYNTSGINTQTFNQHKLETYIAYAKPSVQLYYYTKKYCKEYNVPETVAFGVAKLETYYIGPTKYYNPSQKSYADAYGSYQLLLSTAKDMYEGNPSDITPDRLLKDVNLNTRLGIKYLNYLYKIYGNWTIACGYYNTGYPVINQYAVDATKYISERLN